MQADASGFGRVDRTLLLSRAMNQTLPTPWRPTKAQLLAAHNKRVPDLVAKNLIVLFAGINPGLYTAAIGRHFGRPGNRFWPALHGGGFTPRLFSPFESSLLLDLNLGITNVVDRATARADELTDDELRAGGRRLEAKVKRWRPTVVAFVGLGHYRIVSGIKDAGVGLQKAPFGGSHAWVLPNPSGLNAHYQPAALAQLFGDLRLWAIAETGVDEILALLISMITERGEESSMETMNIALPESMKHFVKLSHYRGQIEPPASLPAGATAGCFGEVMSEEW